MNDGRPAVRRSRSTGRLVVALAVISLVPLGLLAYLSVSLAGDAVREEVEKRVGSTAALSAQVVHGELAGLGELVESYAERPTLTAALGDARVTRRDAEIVEFHLRELRQAHAGIFTTFVADPRGRLTAIVPATPAIVGKSFAFRDWYRGVTATGGPYISRVYRTQATGRPLVVAAAALIRRPGATGPPLGILVAAYDLEYLQRFSNQLADAQGVTLKITDQRGTLVANPEAPVRTLVSRRGDPRVKEALAGRSGVLELDTPDGRRLSAHAPVPEIGWTITASVPANTALAAIGDLRSSVFLIVAALTLVLLAGLVLLGRALRGRRRAEEAALEQAAINRAVLEASRDGIRMVDSEGNVLVSNRAYDELVASVPEVDGDIPAEQRVERIAALTTDPEGVRKLAEAIQADPEYTGTHELELADSGRVFQLYTAPVREADAQLLGRMTVAREVTKEREVERLKTELLATVSHELRTPLASVLGFAELLCERELDRDTQQRYLRTVHSEARRLTGLINDFLDLQRIEAGEFTLALEPFDLCELVREQVEFFAPQSRAHAIECDLPDETVTVIGERARVAQVLGNLLSNAIKYSPAGGSVHVSVTTGDALVRVAIRDEGIGIPAEQQQKLFTKFFRVDSSDTREIGGTGLGLALAREIVEAHGGRLSFESARGEGSTFWFELPYVGSRNGTGKHRILVVENDPASAALLAEYLADEPYDVEIASTAERALQRARDEPPAVICLDIALPGVFDGWGVLEDLKAHAETRDIPVVICTAHNSRNRAAALGAADYLAKPFAPADLRAAVARVLPGGNGSVLVVDDDPAVRRLLVETLSADGFDVDEASDGAEALHHILRYRPDTVVLDLMMPGVDGFAVLERLYDDPALRLLPVIVLTARRLSPAERELLDRRALSLLEKAYYSPRELRALVARAVAREPLDGREQLARAERFR